MPFTAEGLIKSAAIGAFSAAVTFGIGEATAAITQLGTRIAVQAVAHGLFQGTMAGVQGGNFWQGFASGALASVAASLYGGSGYNDANGKFVPQTQGLNGAIGGGDIGMIAFGTVSGGAGTALTGGNFWQGAATGFVVSALNHALHRDDNGYDKNGNKINDNGGNVTDYIYDDDGITILASTEVRYRGISQGEFMKNGGKLEGYGFRGWKLATGAISEDYSLFNIYAGGKTIGLGLSYLGAGLNAIKVPVFKALGNGIKTYFPKLGANRYLRIGISHSKGREVFRITWGNNSKHLLNIDLGKIPSFKNKP